MFPSAKYSQAQAEEREKERRSVHSVFSFACRVFDPPGLIELYPFINLPRVNPIEKGNLEPHRDK